MGVEVTIWHYSRCSKSRKALAILRDAEADITLRSYLDDPPTVDELTQAVERLGIAPRKLVRTGEDLYGELGVDEDALDDAGWIKLLAEHPKLIQRPLVFSEYGAVIGRPPEKVHEVFPEHS